ncbi:MULTISPECIES: hypothetical protein [unclassified Desulfovibrio]|uniref:hypothetical protein n=1 Tax=unclassified Desulfovibrio TaxID=2593640 RepID=UPI0013EAB7AF|nr:MULTISPECIES: hypothetical protein [unclassified Desulfovibrio]
MSDLRTRKSSAMKDLSAAAKGTLDALAALLSVEIDEGHEEMEAADNNQKLWRAQGRVIEARALLHEINSLRGAR